MLPDQLPIWVTIPAAFVLWPWLILTAVRYVRNLNTDRKNP